MTVELRPMRWWDLDVVVALEGELFEDAWSAELFWSELAQRDTRTFLTAWDGAEIVGYAGLADLPDAAWVQTIAVVPHRRRTGLGARLLGALMEDAARRSADSVALEVRVDNEPAQALYRRFGFAPVAIRRGYYQPSGTDALVMVAELVAP
jgi:[ribosomal protein S18]-alanine N-acetyltransferase